MQPDLPPPCRRPVQPFAVGLTHQPPLAQHLAAVVQTVIAVLVLLALYLVIAAAPAPLPPSASSPHQRVDLAVQHGHQVGPCP